MNLCGNCNHTENIIGEILERLCRFDAEFAAVREAASGLAEGLGRIADMLEGAMQEEDVDEDLDSEEGSEDLEAEDGPHAVSVSLPLRRSRSARRS